MEEKEAGNFVVSYWVAERMNGRGVATAVLGALLEEARNLNARAIYAGVSKGNAASVRVLEKYGFRRVRSFADYDRFLLAV